MPVPLDPAKIQGVMRDLGVAPADVDALRRMPFEAAVKHLEELKERVRKNFKRLALELHPDRTGGDAEKTERFKVVSSIKDEFEKLQIRPVPVRPPPVVTVAPPPPVRVVRVVTWTSAGAAYTSRATGTTVTVGIPFNIATMRPT